MEIQAIKNDKTGENVVQADPVEFLHVALDALHYNKNVVEQLEQSTNPNMIELRHNAQKRIESYNRLIYQLQLAAGFDPSEY